MQNQTPITFTPDQVLRAVKGWCWDCGDPVPDYLVQNEVWEAAWPNPEARIGAKKLLRLKRLATKLFPERVRSRDSNLVFVHVHLCFGCLERRIGRPLRITDFIATTKAGKIMTANVGVFLGFRLGEAHAARRAKKAAEARDKKDEGG